MTTLLIGATTLAVAVLSWFGHRAFLRVETWGRNMNDVDRIFQDAALNDGVWDSAVTRKRTRSGISLTPTLKTPHHHA